MISYQWIRFSKRITEYLKPKGHNLQIVSNGTRNGW